jgi:hypothetical protein
MKWYTYLIVLSYIASSCAMETPSQDITSQEDALQPTPPLSVDARRAYMLFRMRSQLLERAQREGKTALVAALSALPAPTQPTPVQPSTQAPETEASQEFEA